MAQLKKAQAIAKTLVDASSLLLPTLLVTEGVDGSNQPTILIGAAAAGATGCFIRVKPVDWTAKDIFGNAADVFGPHVVQIVIEANPAGGAGADVNSIGDVAKMIRVASAAGCKLEVYQSANGAVPAVGGITGVPAASIDVDPRMGLISNQ